MSEKLLVFEVRMMGDAVMSLPFIRAAASRYEVHVCCASGTEELYQHLLDPARVHPWDPPWQGPPQPSGEAHRKMTGLICSLKSLRPEVAVCAWADPRVHGMMVRVGAKRRIGFPVNRENFYARQLGWRKRQIALGKIFNLLASVVFFRPLLNEKITKKNYLQHHVECWRQLADHLQLPWDTTTPWLPTASVPLPPVAVPLIANARAKRKQVWLVHPGARTANRRWPIERFSELVRTTFLPQSVPVLVVQPAEIPDLMVAVEIPVVKTESLTQLIALLHEVDCVLCNDTGIGHLAAALGKKTVSVFSANLPEWFAPYGQEENAVFQDVCPHRPCFDRCVMPSYICRDAVTVEQVRAMVEKVSLSDLEP